MIQRAFRYRLYPTAEQAVLMEQTAGAVRFIYNLALEQRRDFWRQAKAVGRSLDAMSQGRELKDLRRELPWLAAVSTTPLYYALRDLDKAFACFWRGGGYPAFRSKDRYCAFREKGSDLPLRQASRKWALVRVPKIGFVRMRLTRAWRGRVISANFVQEPCGWYVSLTCEIELGTVTNENPAVGIDRGIANTLVLSTGEMLKAPDLIALERQKRRAQRVLARRSRGSQRYRKQRRRVAAISARIVRCRTTWRQRATTCIARRFGYVAIEDLKVVNMSASGPGKRGLNRSILEQGWTEIERMLAYKLEERGGALVKVNPAYTSQECSACGAVDRESRESQARFVCRSCGHRDHADTNAAKNILRRSTSKLPVEACGCAADEAGTINLAA